MKLVIAAIGFLAIGNLAAQQVRKDSVDLVEEVVYTAQLNAQSVKKAIFEVKVISQKEIESMGANNLSDVLNQKLNITLNPDVSSGKSGVTFMGLDSKYLKILIDNIPVINEEGMGNNTDLTTLSLEDIQQIEIVEGAMGVQYGSNAVSGVINIITKKKSKFKWNIHANLQEETVGDEYEWFNKGRHIQGLKIAANLSDNLYGSISYNRNHFAGFWNDKQGENYDVNNRLRGHLWLPKTQNNTKLLLNYTKNNFHAFYKFNLFGESIEKYNSTVNLNENPATATNNPFSIDQKFKNKRYYHHLNLRGKINTKTSYDVSTSYQKQNKNLEQYTYFIRTQKQEDKQEVDYLSRSAFFSRGTLNNWIHSGNFNLQSGYEVTLESGMGSPFAISLDPEDTEVSRQLNAYDFFSSGEFYIHPKWDLRTGARISISNIFDTQYLFSLSSKYKWTKNTQVRAIIGSANRTPNYDELYTYFVDVNHNVQGNENLKTEKGMSAFLHFKNKWENQRIKAKHKLSFSYLDIQDRIELIVINNSPLAYQYNNIDRYKSIGVSTENNFKFKNIDSNIGASLMGISKNLDREINPSNDFLYQLQFNASAHYTMKKIKARASLFVKHTAKQFQFVEQSDNLGNSVYKRAEISPYTWIDASFQKSFYQNKLKTSIGVRNLLDIKTINQSIPNQTAHSSSGNSINLAYGRSFYLQLKYNINL